MLRRRNSRTANLCLVLLLALASFVTASAAPAKKALPDHPIDLNAAGAKELQELPGVGPTTANAIIQFRIKSGRIRRVEDLLAIHGVSEAKLKKLRPYVTLGTPVSATPVGKNPSVHSSNRAATSNSGASRVTIAPKPSQSASQ